jgi:hypothetical protein
MIFERGHFSENDIEKSVVNDLLREAKNFSAGQRVPPTSSVFLSHKHEDLDDLRGVIGLLRSRGAEVYIDSMDNKMPSETTGDTARRIKEMIKFCDKFIFLATAKAIESYWCNWELGIGDAFRYLHHLAIIPLKETGEYDWEYEGNEYLQIYSRIDFEPRPFTDGRNGRIHPSGYYVEYPEDEDGITVVTRLTDWLKG